MNQSQLDFGVQQGAAAHIHASQLQTTLVRDAVGNTSQVFSRSALVDELTSTQPKQFEAKKSSIKKAIFMHVEAVNPFSNEWLLPMLASYKQPNRWVCLVAPKSIPIKGEMIRSGLEAEQVLVLRPELVNDRFSTALKMMQSGHSGLLAIWSEGLNELQKARLQRTAEETGCHCIIIS